MGGGKIYTEIRRKKISYYVTFQVFICESLVRGGVVVLDCRRIERMRRRIMKRGLTWKIGCNVSDALFRIMRLGGRGAFALNRNEEKLLWIRSVL